MFSWMTLDDFFSFKFLAKHFFLESVQSSESGHVNYDYPWLHIKSLLFLQFLHSLIYFLITCKIPQINAFCFPYKSCLPIEKKMYANWLKIWKLENSNQMKIGIQKNPRESTLNVFYIFFFQQFFNSLNQVFFPWKSRYAHKLKLRASYIFCLSCENVKSGRKMKCSLFMSRIANKGELF